MVVICLQELSYHQLIGLQNLVESLMHSLLFVLNSMVQNDIKPGLAYIKFRDWVVLDYLQNQIISPVECCLKRLVLNFEGLVNFLQNLDTHLTQNVKQLLTYLQVHTNELPLLDWQHVQLDVLQTAVLYEGDQFL